MRVTHIIAPFKSLSTPPEALFCCCCSLTVSPQTPFKFRKLRPPDISPVDETCCCVPFISYTADPQTPKMNGTKKPTLCSDAGTSPTLYKSFYVNPLTDPSDKENAARVAGAVPCNGRRPALRHSSLRLCMRANEPDATSEGLKLRDPPSAAYEAWELSDTEVAPASSWATLPNKSLLCRPLPLDVGRCTCIIAREKEQGRKGIYLYSLYTNEGQGRQDRKLAVARHARRNGQSEFIVALRANGVFNRSDESFLGSVNANLVGSKYHLWGQVGLVNSSEKHSRRLLGVVTFEPTIRTWTGSYRSIAAWIPKHQSMQLKNTNQIQHINGLPKDWEEKKNKCHQLCSKVPSYNSGLRRYELDFRERGGRNTYRIQASVKNFQLIMEEKGSQMILQLARIGKAKYVMEFRYPFTGYQAFCICLASIDSKLCCSV